MRFRNLLLSLAPLGAALVATAAPALSWRDQPGSRVASVTVQGGQDAGFTLLSSAATGLAFTNFLSAADQEANHNLLNGAGVALGDVDGDGLTDLFFCSIGGQNALFKNHGDWKFSDVSAASGVAATRTFAHAAALSDTDGDGDLDLLLTLTGKGTKLLLNDGKGRFTDATPNALAISTGPSSAALADVDGDTDLDLYVANYGEKTIRSGALISTTMVNGQEVVAGRLRNRLKIINGALVEYGEPDRFYLNDGNGQFSHVSFTSGAFLNERGEPIRQDPWDLGLSVMFRDINQDGLPDIYICNDFQNPDRIWMNRGDGKFQAIARNAIRLSSHFSMGVDFADIDRDGFDDFMVVDMLSRDQKLKMTQISPATPPIAMTLEDTLDRPQVRRNMLYHNRGDGTYAEIAPFSGVEATDWAWCPVFLDVDLDGYEDILVSNGHAYDTQDMDAMDQNEQLRKKTGRRGGNFLSAFPKLETPNVAFRNRRDLTFEEVGAKWGFDSKQVSHGMALGDLDNDGDLDVVVNCLNAPALLYRNESNKPRVAVRLRGAGKNRFGIGARVSVRAPALPEQSQEFIAGGRYLSSDDPVRMFAVAKPEDKVEVRVTWRSGRQSIVSNVAANSIVEVDEAAAQPAGPKAATAARAPLFARPPEVLSWRHSATGMNDFEFQPLLLHKWSSGVPSVAVTDLSNDGQVDMLVSGQGDALLTKLVNNNGERLVAGDGLGKRAGTEVNVLLPLGGPGDAIVVGQQPTPGRDQSTTLHSVDPKTGQTTVVSAGNILWGALAAADLNGDGSVELFAGARSAPGKYPTPFDSLIIPTKNGQVQTQAITRLQAGIVTGAGFADLNQDGWPDLVAANEGGPIRIWTNQKGELVETTTQLGLSTNVGWWNSVAFGDFNSDGRIDLVAGNWGLNSVHRATAKAPFTVYHGDFDGNQITDLFPAQFDEGAGREAPMFDFNILRANLPTLAEPFTSHAQYASAEIGKILGRPTKEVPAQRLTTFASAIFLNHGSHFERRDLPREAQLAPVFGIGCADFDNDGHTDLLLAQNFFGVRPELFPFNAGRGLVLRGDGKGGFKALSAQESGVEIYGEQRAVAVADFNQDGRVDSAVFEHNGPAHLLLNRTPAKGVRVKMNNTSSASGATVRPIYKDGSSGAANAISLQGGHSVKAFGSVVLGRADEIAEIEVRWPHGKTTKTPVNGAVVSVEAPK